MSVSLNWDKTWNRIPRWYPVPLIITEFSLLARNAVAGVGTTKRGLLVQQIHYNDQLGSRQDVQLSFACHCFGAHALTSVLNVLVHDPGRWLPNQVSNSRKITILSTYTYWVWWKVRVYWYKADGQPGCGCHWFGSVSEWWFSFPSDTDQGHSQKFLPAVQLPVWARQAFSTQTFDGTAS